MIIDKSNNQFNLNIYHYSKDRGIGFIHQQIVPIFRKIVLDTNILCLPELRDEKIGTNHENTQNEVRMNVARSKKLIKDERKHVHKFGNEAEHT